MPEARRGATPVATAMPRLRDIFGDDLLPGDDPAATACGDDRSGFYTADPGAVVWPRSAAQLQRLVALAIDVGLALVPSGGRTGLSGGAVAARGELVVSFERMRALSDFQPLDRSVRCEAGVITAELQAFAESQGLYYPVDFASSGSSQIGGNIATNAGGIKVIRHGLTRDRVAALEVVTGRGDLLQLNGRGLVKNATGYDLRQLFIGAEGTLGFITAATLRLAAAPPPQRVMVLGAPSIEAIMQLLGAFQGELALSAFEFFSDRALGHLLARGQVPAPFAARYPLYALIEFDAPGEAAEAAALSVFEDCLAAGRALDGVLSQSEQQARQLWRLREDISETLAEFTPYKNDLSVCVHQIPEFIAACDQVISAAYADFEVLWYGHIGDGNVHLNILKPGDWSTADFKSRCEAVNARLFPLVERFGGSISAEHGVGLIKRDYLGHSRSAAEIDYLRAVKAVFDPHGVMNPGKLLAAGSGA